MPIDPISWVLIWSFAAGAGAGALVAVFWDEIKAWATRVLGIILDAINYAIEVTSDAITSLVERGTRVYKRVAVHVRNIYTGATKLRYKEEEISRYDVPEDIEAEFRRKTEIILMRQSTPT